MSVASVILKDRLVWVWFLEASNGIKIEKQYQGLVFFLFLSFFFESRFIIVTFLKTIYIPCPYFIKVKIFLNQDLRSYVLANSLNFGVPLNFNANFIYYFLKEVDTTIFHEFFYQIKDKINFKP